MRSSRDVLTSEYHALRTVLHLHHAIENAADYLAKRQCIVTTGIGKSGHVALNVASTMNTLGVPAKFIHAEEALHGELGFVTGTEGFIAFSASGATGQVVTFTHAARERGCKTVAVVGDPGRALAVVAERVITLRGPLNDAWVVPTASLVASLAVGHALAVALAERRGGDVLMNHPGGFIGGK